MSPFGTIDVTIKPDFHLSFFRIVSTINEIITKMCIILTLERKNGINAGEIET